MVKPKGGLEREDYDREVGNRSEEEDLTKAKGRIEEKLQLTLQVGVGGGGTFFY